MWFSLLSASFAGVTANIQKGVVVRDEKSGVEVVGHLLVDEQLTYDIEQKEAVFGCSVCAQIFGSILDLYPFEPAFRWSLARRSLYSMRMLILALKRRFFVWGEGCFRRDALSSRPYPNSSFRALPLRPTQVESVASLESWGRSLQGLLIFRWESMAMGSILTLAIEE